MFVAFSFLLLQYLRKVFIPFCLLGIWSCKDFKNWEATYGSEVKVRFESKKDKLVPDIVEDLDSFKIEDLDFIKYPITNSDKNFLLKDDLLIPLDPNADQVSFELESIDQRYYQKVTICYQRISHLISPEGGNLQIQYTIKDVQFSTKNNKNTILKEFSIDSSIPLQKEKDKPHVTLYY